MNGKTQRSHMDSSGQIGRLRLAIIALLLAMALLPSAHGEAADSAGTWLAANAMTAARYLHTATLLPNGTVLVAGGQTNAGPLGSAEIYDPGTNAWNPTGSMSAERTGHTATLLANGKVLVAGGGDARVCACRLARSCTIQLPAHGVSPAA